MGKASKAIKAANSGRPNASPPANPTAVAATGAPATPVAPAPVTVQKPQATAAKEPRAPESHAAAAPSVGKADSPAATPLDEGGGEGGDEGAPEQPASNEHAQTLEEAGWEFFKAEKPEELPDWLSALDARAEIEQAKSWKVPHPDEVLSKASPEVQKLFHNFRRAFLVKTQQVADQAKQVETQKIDLEKDRHNLTAERVQLYEQLFGNPELAKMLTPAEGEAPAAHTPEGIAWAAREQAKGLVKEWLDAVQGNVKNLREEHAKAQAELGRKAWVDSAKEYIAQHPDVVAEHWTEIKTLLGMRDAQGGQVWELPKAHEYVLFQKGKHPSQQQKAPVDESAKRAQALSMPGGQRSGGKPRPPANMKTADYAEWLDANPDSVQAEYDRYLKRRGLSYG